MGPGTQGLMGPCGNPALPDLTLAGSWTGGFASPPHDGFALITHKVS